MYKGAGEEMMGRELGKWHGVTLTRKTKRQGIITVRGRKGVGKGAGRGGERQWGY